MRKASVSVKLMTVSVLAVALVWGSLGGPGQAAAQETANTAITPVSRGDDWWMPRHEGVVERVKQGNVDLLMIGDSINHGWENGGKAVWDAYYGDRNAVNMGFSGDRTQHVLWRLDNGEIDGISPKLAAIMIGTNNWHDNSAEEIADGVKAIVAKLRAKLPEMKILLLAIFPRADVEVPYREKLVQANALFSKCADGDMVHYLDIGRVFLDADGNLPKSVMPDFLHPNAYGYQLWAEAVEPSVARLMGEIDAGKAPKGFVHMFNGKDLNGWRGVPKGPYDNPEKRAELSPEDLAKVQAEANAIMHEHWKVVDGALEYDGGGFSMAGARDYDDFEMLVDWKIHELGDSGIYLRGAPQVQIWDPAKWPVGSGGLYNNQKNPSNPLVCADNPIGEWNTFRIKMIGERVTVHLNDQLVVDNVVLENYWNREIPIWPSGQIELQHHGSTLWFKNIFVRDIPRGDGWKPLFNGKDLTGWEQVGGEKQTWKAEDGILYTSGEGGGWLSTAEEYGDFELDLEFRVPENGNSGVFIRAPREGNPAFAGSEVQVLDDYGSEYTELKPWQYTGSVYATAAPSRRATLPAGTWQRMQIRCEGSKVNVAVNNIPIVDVDLNDHEDKVKDHPGLKRTSGYIGFQNHGSRLDYRNIRIRPLN
jgi:lysophospholipase L1-like esterase